MNYILETDNNVSLITSYLNLTLWTVEADSKLSVKANNLYLLYYTMEADNKSFNKRR